MPKYFAAAFNLPTLSLPKIYHSEVLPWIGVLFCLFGLVMLFLSLVSFGKSFRVEEPLRPILHGLL